MEFQSYIQNLKISMNFKDQILNSEFIERNPIYYKNYPTLFSKVFSLQSSQLDLLDIAGYLYYQSTIFTDTLIDKKDLSKFPLISICQEESIKILSSIFGLEHDFWRLWNMRREEYFRAVYLEKGLSKKDFVAIEEYEALADLKSAFGKIAIDCLFSLDNSNEDAYQKLLLSHHYFSAAFQLNDDIQDFKEDFKSGQFNWAFYLLKKHNIANQDPDVLEKYLYIRGIAKEIYNLGIEYCDKALTVIEEIEVLEWKKILADTKRSFLTAIIEIDNYLAILTSEISLSNTLFPENNLVYSISSAIKFVKSKQEPDGSWREYSNQGGISNTWSTAFIVSKISEAINLQAVFKNETCKALGFLQENPIKTLWSYNTTWIEDADSTNFVLLSFLHNNIRIEEEVAEKWLLFQRQNGGFSTYSDSNHLLTALDDRNIKSAKGWLSVQNCVSAVSFYFLALQDPESNSFTAVKKYFDENLNRELHSYWWTDKTYTCYYLAKTYMLLEEKEKAQYIISKIIEKQNYNGSFSDCYGENLFYTGLSLEIMLLDDDSNKTQIEKTIAFLLQKQYDDGSWENSHALQVPDPDIEDMIPAQTHFPIATFGINVRAKEFSRLFTTISILQSLAVYEYKYSSATV